MALSLFAALFTRLWYLQVLTTDEYEVAAETTAPATVILEAPRGRIFDRNGKPLVENRRTIQVRSTGRTSTSSSRPSRASCSAGWPAS